MMRDRWFRGKEAPMDTSPAGPRQPSVFDTPDPADMSIDSSSGGPLTPSKQPTPHLQEPLADVEMNTLTPPSNRFQDHPNPNQDGTAAAPGPSSSSGWVDEGASSATRDPSPSRQRPYSSAAVHLIKRKRSLQTKTGRMRRHGQQLVVARKSARNFDGQLSGPGDGDGDEDGDDDDDDVDDDDDDDDDDRSLGRIGPMTKNIVNYFLPGSGHPGAGPNHHHQQFGAMAPSKGAGPPSAVHHLDWPELLLGYAQFLFNASILAAFLYLLFSIIRTVQQDVAEKVRGYEMDTLSEITACAASYAANRCGTEMQAPALAAACLNWERCSARDPAVVGRARVTAETFAEILNGFVDVVSWKSMVFSLVTLSIIVGATNSVFSFFRIRSRRQREQPHQSQQPPPTLQQQQQQQQPQHQHQQHQHLPPAIDGGAGAAAPYGYMGHHPHPAAAYYHHPPPPLPAWSMGSAPSTPARRRMPRSGAVAVE
ncbi:uncharacterized protein PFL1_01114 [Pseudozyma flocculosa PF-1]|uniref:Related to BRL1 - essential nuclear envelope integral membrane protein n=1 Tax=Pseudozyma flocculosa TaxID=84751 RepID=A0A5C3FBV7_9BASI|nr:uncharacterized protein PFL1_01114 [Pseudozyma flocculosa PF-1]EPQ31782.1 hypothetical protein PFL1_01114 [Pseudozyma flocculosa PF-1]SPO41828.1 related to BRL1 - essential nuclear envelope integral membrane protein [Pseudozyma flocculosa]